MHTDNKIKSVKNPDSDVINVIEEFDYSGPNDKYNEGFKSWRLKKKNKYSYNYNQNQKEKIFIDGQGFVSSTAADAERDSLSKLFLLLGNLLLCYVFIETVAEKLFIVLLDILGFNISYSFFSGAIYGGKSEILFSEVVVSIVKYFIPIAIMHRVFKMPNKVRYPMRKIKPYEFFYALSTGMIISVISSISRAYSDKSREVYDYFNNAAVDLSFFGDYELVVYLFFDILVVSIMNELMFRGEAFHVLRQYGDFFAVVVTSVFSTLVICNFKLMPACFLISFVSGVLLLRSGNIFISIFMHILNKLYLLGLLLIETNSSAAMFLTRSFYMSVVFALGVIIILIIATKHKSETVLMKNLHTHLNAKEKTKTIFHSLSLVGVIIACVFASIWNVII